MTDFMSDDDGALGIGKRFSQVSNLQIAYQVEFSVSSTDSDFGSTPNQSCSVSTPLHTLYWVRKWIRGLVPKLSETGARQALDWLLDIDSACRSVQSLTVVDSYLVSISDSNGVSYSATITPILCLPLIGVHEIREDGDNWFR